MSAVAHAEATSFSTKCARKSTSRRGSIWRYRANIFASRPSSTAGPDCVERYYRLCNRLTPRVLAESEGLPKWLRSKGGYDIWQRTNLWMLYNALALHGKELTLIALWDTRDGDGPGGSDDLVFQVSSRGYKLLRLPAEELKSLA